ncbi:hypothetical protein WKH08_09610 [Pantoea agglomerans]|uniref:hypothetical protein n=1 Tax=Enterobacter agglomerans TaxID=549 RepID=UPI003C7AF936
MIKVDVYAESQKDIALRGYLETSTHPSPKLEYLVVEFSLVVIEEPTSDMLFSELHFGDKVKLSAGGAEFRSWEFMYRKAEGYAFRQIFKQPI